VKPKADVIEAFRGKLDKKALFEKERAKAPKEETP